MLRKQHLLVVSGIAAAACMGAGVSLAATGSAAPAAAKSTTIHGCENTKTHVLYVRHAKSCGKGYTALSWNVTGPQGAKGATGPAGPVGPTGPRGPAGANGTSAVQTFTASTMFSVWPETSGWANDTFTRNGTLTLDGEVPADDCGGAAQSCYLYKLVASDSGSTTTVNGQSNPNGQAGTIQGTWTGTMPGSLVEEFYASTDKPDPAQVPAEVTGAQEGKAVNGWPVSNTDWFEQFFPAGTLIANASPDSQPGYAPFVTYDWTYTIPVTCGTASTVTETWNDAINPGDDGQSAADGSITGAAVCPAS
jgi:hypothetical protein